MTATSCKDLSTSGGSARGRLSHGPSLSAVLGLRGSMFCREVDQPGVAEGVAAYRRWRLGEKVVKSCRSGAHVPGRNSISSDAHKRLLADVSQCFCLISKVKAMQCQSWCHCRDQVHPVLFSSTRSLVKKARQQACFITAACQPAWSRPIGSSRTSSVVPARRKSCKRLSYCIFPKCIRLPVNWAALCYIAVPSGSRSGPSTPQKSTENILIRHVRLTFAQGGGHFSNLA